MAHLHFQRGMSLFAGISFLLHLIIISTTFAEKGSSSSSMIRVYGWESDFHTSHLKMHSNTLDEDLQDLDDDDYDSDEEFDDSDEDEDYSIIPKVLPITDPKSYHSPDHSQIKVSKPKNKLLFNKPVDADDEVHPFTPSTPKGGGNQIPGTSVHSTGSPLHGSTTETHFSTENSTVIIAQTGSTASLPCIVKNIGNGVASWIRRKDYVLLTVGMGTYSNDERFMVSHNRPAQNWELHIKKVKKADESIYECQISSHPPTSIFVSLKIVEARAEILGEPDKHVRQGSTFELVCVLRDSTEPPVYVFWYHNDRMINYDRLRGVVVTSDTEKSILTIHDAQKTDNGNYSCFPSNAAPTSINVHILNGEKPSAMLHSRNHSSQVVSQPSLTLLILTFSLLSWATWLSNLPNDPLTSFLNQKKRKKKDTSQQENDISCKKFLPYTYYNTSLATSNNSTCTSDNLAKIQRLSSDFSSTNHTVMCSFTKNPKNFSNSNHHQPSCLIMR